MSKLSSVLDASYVFEFSVGEWALGTVLTLQDRKTRSFRTCKVVEKRRLTQPSYAVARLKKLQLIDHPHISRILDVQEDDENVYILTERFQGGDIAEWVQRLDEGFQVHEATCATYVRQILLALVHCHSKALHHGDLNPSHVQLTTKLPDAIVKVEDFGLVDLLEDPATMPKKGRCPFTAPELRFGGPPDFSGSRDVWSVGAIAHSLLVGQAPDVRSWSSRTRKWFFEDNADIWYSRSQASLDFVGQLLVPEMDRPTAARMLHHPWIRSYAAVAMPLDTDPILELNQRTICYMLAVLLVPVLVPRGELKQLCAEFKDADVDADGVIPSAVAGDILGRRCRLAEAVAAALDTVDIGSTGVHDACAVACGDLIARKFFASGPTARPLSCPLVTAELVQRMMARFFQEFGDRQALVSLRGLSLRLQTPTAREFETHCGVSYDDILQELPEDATMDAHVLSTRLTASACRGTPMGISEAAFHTNEVEGACGPIPCGHDHGGGLDGMLLGFFGVCSPQAPASTRTQVKGC